MSEEFDDTLVAGVSIRQQIASLGEGESFSRCERLDYDRLTKESLIKAIATLRNSTQAAMRRAASDTGNIFTIETGDFWTRSRDLILAVVVTRVE
jgi:hypothetical protein